MLTQNFFLRQLLSILLSIRVNFGNILFWVKECAKRISTQNKISVCYDRCQEVYKFLLLMLKLDFSILEHPANAELPMYLRIAIGAIDYFAVETLIPISISSFTLFYSATVANNFPRIAICESPIFDNHGIARERNDF